MGMSCITGHASQIEREGATMIKWLVEDAINTILALVLIVITFLICKLLGVIPTFVVVLLLAFFWGASIFLFVKVCRWRDRLKSKADDAKNQSE